MSDDNTDDIEETTQGHPPEDWTGMYDEEDPDAGPDPYPEDIEDDDDKGEE